MPDKQLPSLFSAETLDLSFPPPKDYIQSEHGFKTRSLIQAGGVFTPEGKAFVAKSELPHVLSTDAPGANQFYNDLPNEYTMQDGGTRYVAAAALNKELSRRIQEPRDVQKREQLKDAEACVNAFRDHPELEKRRALAESRIERALPKLKRQMLKAETITACQVSGAPLERDAEIHHVFRQADQPSKSLDPRNLLLVNKTPHREIHDAGAHSPNALAALAREKNWPYEPRG